MHNEPNSRLPGEGQTAAQAPEALNAAALARRRALIKGLGKGGAALAVVAPIQSYAAPKLQTGQVCSLSGLQSGVTSHTPASALLCQGWPPEHFESKGLPNDWPAGVDPLTATFSSVFGGSDNRLLLKVLNDATTDAKPPGYVVTVEQLNAAYWVAAYFNAKTASNNWVYTPEQVVAQYQLGGTQADAYLNFYKAYLSQRTV